MIGEFMSNETHVQPLAASLIYLRELLKTRLLLHFGKKSMYRDLGEIVVPAFNGTNTPFTHFVSEMELTREEYSVLLLSLAPHVQASFFDAIIAEVIPDAGDYPLLGGTRGKQFRGFLPTGETALFLLAGDDLQRRFDVQYIFNEDHLFARQRILRLEDPQEGEPLMSGRLILDQDFVELFTLGQVALPKFTMSFPARRIHTEMEWEDLVLNGQTLKQVHELEDWIKHGNTLLYDWGMNKRIKPGYRALFYGPPGTGKTLTASLLGKYTNREVYKVDLSMVVSKFIGETEKNLSRLFAKAENKDWILFFDEADSLFGKRTGVRDAHDKYANQEVSYLLQRVESYNGLVILASNFKTNIDEAFMRRFQSVIHFPMPKSEERLRIWELAFPAAVNLSGEIILAHVAKKYELSGSSIMNVVQYCCLRALSNGSRTVRLTDIQDGVRREFAKEGKVV